MNSIFEGGRGYILQAGGSSFKPANCGGQQIVMDWSWPAVA
jgi:hypothetical protein